MKNLQKEEGVKGVKGITAKDSEHIDAIARRHEADEVRHGVRSMNRKKTSMAYKGDKLPMTAYNGAHLSPKVILSESAHTAVAPSKVREFMNHMRGLTGEKPGLAQTEKFIPGAGHHYGKSGVFNNKVGKKLERILAKGNKSTIKGLLSLK
jgi:hypothetical protein